LQDSSIRNSQGELTIYNSSVVQGLKRVLHLSVYFRQINAQHGLRTAQIVQTLNDVDNWKTFKEPIPQEISNTTHIGNRFLEHLSTTKDETDYLWYLSR
jgi:hypothetical protein